MAFSVPPLGDLISRTREDFRARLGLLPGASPTLRRSLYLVAATVWAGVVHLVHGHMDWAAKQILPQTAEREQLVLAAAPYGLTINPATYAGGSATATGTNGSPIPINTVLKRSDGARYRVTSQQTIAAGTATLPLEALLAGTSGNAAGATVLTFESPVGGVNSTATVTGAGLINGVDEETTDQFRARFALRLQEPPEGGADHDYEQWALGVTGVTRVWVYEHELGLGTVVVRFVRDNDGSGAAVLPDAGEIAAVVPAIAAERPVTAEVTVLAPTALTVNYTLTSLTPNNATTQAAVTAALAELHETEAEAGDGAGRGTLLISKIRNACGDAEGVTDYVLSVPSANVVPALGQLPILGTITFPV
jgi:uncharacterized phage protein gp47/JayE